VTLFRTKKWKYYSAIWSRFDGRWKWEGQPHQQYTQVELLGELGQMGWELVAIAPYSDDGKVMAHEYIFKKKA
jgi:hypothetical protein